MPLSMIFYIASYLTPSKVTREEIREFTCQIKSIALLNRKCYEVCQTTLARLKIIDTFANKYHAYNTTYLYSANTHGNPHLLDALFTGYSSASTFNSFTPEIEADIKTIVNLTPQSLSCTLGILGIDEKERSQLDEKTIKKAYDAGGYSHTWFNPFLTTEDHISPLIAASMNRNISLNVIEFLLEKGADQNATVTRTNRSSTRVIAIIDTFSTIDYLNKKIAIIGTERLAQVMELFKKYSTHQTQPLPLISVSFQTSRKTSRSNEASQMSTNTESANLFDVSRKRLKEADYVQRN